MSQAVLKRRFRKLLRLSVITALLVSLLAYIISLVLFDQQTLLQGLGNLRSLMRLSR